jgi:hypothetical protein
MPDAVPASVQRMHQSSDLMNKIAAAAIAAASTTAHAVISAAGPEYLQVIQELAKRDQRLSFLACPVTELVAPFSMQPAEHLHHSLQIPTAAASSCPMLLAQPTRAVVDSKPTIGTSLPPTCVSPSAGTANPSGSGCGFPAFSSIHEQPPMQFLSQLLSLPPASSQLVSDQLGQDLAAPLRERLDTFGQVPATTGMTENFLLSRFNDSNTPDTVTHAAPPLTAFTAPNPGPPGMDPPAPILPHTLQGPPHSAAEQRLHAVSALKAAPPASRQVQSTEHAAPAPTPYSCAAISTPLQAVQLVQAQQQHQQHVFPKQQGQAADLPATTTGYGQQGSGGGSGGNSGGEMNDGSGDKSGSKSAKQSANVKTQDAIEGLPAHIEAHHQAPEFIPLSQMVCFPCCSLCWTT